MSKAVNDYCVYLHYRLNGDKSNPFYIGIGSLSRSHRNEGRNNLWTKIYNKYGKEVKYFINGCSKQEAFVFERMLISQYGKIINNTGYLSNITDGGESGLTRAVICDGVLYSSLSSAASALGLSGPEAIHQKIKSPLYDYYYAGCKNNYNSLLKRKSDPIAVIADGVRYNSISECARKYKISIAGLRTRIKSPRFNFMEEGGVSNYNSSLNKNGFAKPIIAGDIMFTSLTDAANYFGKSLTSMFRLVNSKNNNFRYATQE
jgi:hypothetical protein